jgi:hypothetical protein
MRSRERSQPQSSTASDDGAEGGEEHPPVPPTMAVSIAGFSTACSKNALVSSAKAAREALSTE